MSKLRRSQRYFIQFIAIVLYPSLAQAQQLLETDINALWYILNAKAEGDVWIYPDSYRRLPPIFLPNDLGLAQPDGLVYDHLSINKSGTYITIEGTGRVYRLGKLEPRGIKFDRVDSTRFFGYNYGACVFTYRDTLYSLGGYGYWQYNGQLRYFDPAIHGWKTIPLNRTVQARDSEIGIYVDHRSGHLWYTNPINKYEEIKPEFISEEMKEEDKMFRLDLKNKFWEAMGKQTPEFKSLKDQLSLLAQIPIGALVCDGGVLDPRIYLVKYQDNKVSKLTNKDLAQKIGRLVSGGEVTKTTGRPLAWYAGDSLHVYRTGFGHSSFSLDESGFTDTGIKIYKPISDQAAKDIPESLKIILLLSGGLTFGAFVGYGIFRRRHLQKALDEPEYFSPIEQVVLKTMNAAPGRALSVEELDELLGTARKSKDMQNQKRSSVTRSINHTYQVITGDTENLIETRRQEFDRRMIRYELNQSKFAAIRDRVNGT